MNVLDRVQALCRRKLIILAGRYARTGGFARALDGVQWNGRGGYRTESADIICVPPDQPDRVRGFDADLVVILEPVAQEMMDNLRMVCRRPGAEIVLG